MLFLFRDVDPFSFSLYNQFKKAYLFTALVFVSVVPINNRMFMEAQSPI